MGFPNKEQFKRALKKMEGSEGTLALDPNATALDRFRWELHQKFVKYKRVKNLSQRELADLLQIDAGKISKILHHRLDEFSTDRLIKLYEKLAPKVKLRIS